MAVRALFKWTIVYTLMSADENSGLATEVVGDRACLTCGMRIAIFSMDSTEGTSGWRVGSSCLRPADPFHPASSLIHPVPRRCCWIVASEEGLPCCKMIMNSFK